MASYLRAAADLSVNRAFTRTLRATAMVSGGTSAGTLPHHRWWNIGGWQTVRGLTAGSMRGDAYWMGRGEISWARMGRVQPGLFWDAGWAGDRRRFAARREVRSSVGGGAALFGLPVRVEAARELAAGARWRVDVYAPIRF
jgi:hemolysin activation/secretion protein